MALSQQRADREPRVAPDQYELVDFGGGRKLERFGAYLLDRPSPAAEGVARQHPALWQQADARYQRRTSQRGQWSVPGALEQPWLVTWGPLRLELKLTESGHVGVFAEQADNWRWIAGQVRQAGEPIKVLNLFAYTGASTLAAAAAGAAVTHVDAAGNVVAWARRNAAASQLADAPIRWIVEDAFKFVRRELKRGAQYQAVILDPPSYGHGPKGEAWKLAEQLAELWEACLELTRERRCFLLASCHSEPWSQGEALAEYLVQQSPPPMRRPRGWMGADMFVATAAGRQLPSGALARYQSSNRAAAQAGGR